MTNWLEEQHKNRCEGKTAYPRASIADQQAEKATHRTHRLIISYQCVDCGRWHIGHADDSQILARVLPTKPTCTVCGNSIPESRLQKARKIGSRTTTCSRSCAKRARRSRRRDRKRAQDTPLSPD